MVRLRERDRPGFGYHLKVHSFRMLTVILAWGLIVAAFYQKPEMLTGAQRLMQRGIEALGDAVPPPWGPRMEFVFRENRRLDLASDHLGGARASHGVIDDRGDLAAYRTTGSRPVGSMKLLANRRGSQRRNSLNIGAFWPS
jgi:hypothetical protein